MELSELADSIWILIPYVIYLMKTFLAEDCLNDYMNTMTHYMFGKQFLSPACSMDS